ncbi:heterokaryon incompatibility protein-domain-containing protein [Thelonectria olida]|uniref:Heterokaryon incompatibility protein-domain-containing protein n=1 Tax=Thelonectria olida TaxID=1576542 RepID=A0A9P8W2S6_9HYPO|nr:heterokaryon incompatibility protein-domain-containing protein [Thelonectria olida]
MNSFSPNDHKAKSSNSSSAPQPQFSPTNKAHLPTPGSELNAVRAFGESVSEDWVTSQNLCQNLCSECLASRDAVLNDTSHVYIIRLEQLQKSNCEFCDVLCRALHWSGTTGNSGQDLFIFVRKASLEINLMDGVAPGVRLDCEPGISCPWGIVAQERQDLPAPGSLETVRQIFKWISHCKRTHKLCNVQDPNFMPTRLIDLGSSNDTIRLIETDPQTQGPYVCLSHCWGRKKPLTTKADNLQMHLQSIRWHGIPQTFRDAICYTRLLRIRYIWIDSLCIIQDNPDDWATESKVMGQIYSNAYLTLGAVTAPDSSTGMFKISPSLGLHSARKITGTTITGLPYLYNVFSVPRKLDLHPAAWRSYDDRKSWPLLGRAWAFQECIMSPRFLHIGHPELRWECREAILCECGDIEQKSAKVRYATVLESGSAFQLEKERRDLIEAYSLLSLTCETDKLPAFSGLAKQACRTAPSSEYLAGLFRGSLVVDMLWIAQKHDPKSYRPKLEHWRAPSWSWASVDAFVVFPLSSYYHISNEEPDKGSMLKSYMEIIDARCTPTTSDPTGQVSDGFVTLRGPAYDCLIRDGRLSSASADQGGPIDGEIHLDHPDHVPPQQVCIIRAATFKRMSSHPSLPGGIDTEYSLVLECIDASTKTYRRLGVFTQRRGQHIKESPRKYHPNSFGHGRLETVTIM